MELAVLTPDDEELSMGRPDWAPEAIDVERPSAARTYDYLLGGSHNFAVDRQAAGRTLQVMPNAANNAKQNRAFMNRAVRYLLSVGVRQFLDIGSGIPTVGNVHEVAHRIDPAARIVYVDTDPIAVAHSQAILAGDARATVIQQDLRRPAAILDHPKTRTMLDLDQPVGLLLVAVLHAIPDQDDPYRLVATLRDALAAGSHLAISHMTGDSRFDNWETILSMAEQAGYPITLRTHSEVERFFTGLELVQPGLVRPPLWRPEDPADPRDLDLSNSYAGLAHKP